METRVRLQLIQSTFNIVDVKPTGRWKIVATDKTTTTLWIEVTWEHHEVNEWWEKPHFWSRPQLITCTETEHYTEFVSEENLMLTVTHTYPINECGSK